MILKAKQRLADNLSLSIEGKKRTIEPVSNPGCPETASFITQLNSTKRGDTFQGFGGFLFFFGEIRNSPWKRLRRPD
jgi:hypothetical protein